MRVDKTLQFLAIIIRHLIFSFIQKNVVELKPEDVYINRAGDLRSSSKREKKLITHVYIIRKM